MKTERVLISEQLPEINLFTANVRRIESLIITFYETQKLFEQTFIFNSTDLISCIDNPQEFILNFYRNKINVPERDAATGLPINKEQFINAEISKLQIPDYLRLIEISKDIKMMLERLNVTLEQVVKKQDVINAYEILNKKRVEDIIDGRFRVFTNSLEEKTFVVAYKELIDRANSLQRIHLKNTGGVLRINDLFFQDEHEFKMKPFTLETFKKSILIKQ